MSVPPALQSEDELLVQIASSCSIADRVDSWGTFGGRCLLSLTLGELIVSSTPKSIDMWAWIHRYTHLGVRESCNQWDRARSGWNLLHFCAETGCIQDKNVTHSKLQLLLVTACLTLRIRTYRDEVAGFLSCRQFPLYLPNVNFCKPVCLCIFRDSLHIKLFSYMEMISKEEYFTLLERKFSYEFPCLQLACKNSILFSVSFILFVYLSPTFLI